MQRSNDTGPAGLRAATEPSNTVRTKGYNDISDNTMPSRCARCGAVTAEGETAREPLACSCLLYVHSLLRLIVSMRTSWFVTKPLSHHDSLDLMATVPKHCNLGPLLVFIVTRLELITIRYVMLYIRLVCAGVRMLFGAILTIRQPITPATRLVLALPTIYFITGSARLPDPGA